MARINNCFAGGISSAPASRRLFQPILETLFGNDHAQLLLGLDSLPHLENRHVAQEYNRMKRLLYVERELATKLWAFSPSTKNVAWKRTLHRRQMGKSKLACACGQRR